MYEGEEDENAKTIWWTLSKNQSAVRKKELAREKRGNDLPDERLKANGKTFNDLIGKRTAKNIEFQRSRLKLASMIAGQLCLA